MKLFTRALFALVPVVGLTVVAFGQDIGRMPEFSSHHEAYEKFVATDDVVVRTAAYEKMKAMVENSVWIDTFPSAVNWFCFMARELNRADDIEKTLLTRIAQKESQPEVRYACVKSLSGHYGLTGTHDKSISLLLEHIEKSSDYTAAQIQDMANTTMEYLSGLMRYVDILELYGKTAKILSSKNDVGIYVKHLDNYASFLRNTMKDDVGAEKLAREILAYGEECPYLSYNSAVELLYAIEKARGNNDLAIEAIMLILSRPFSPPPRITDKLVTVGASPEVLEKAIAMLRGWVASSDSIGAIQHRISCVQPDVVEALIALKKYEEAMKECRVFVFTASEHYYAYAVGLTAQTLKTLDGNMGRVNEFLAFQQSDEKSVPDTKNILLSFSALNDTVRQSAFEKMLESPPITWEAWLVNAYMLIWLDKPEESIKATLEAFKLCPFDDISIQRCVSAVVKPVITATRDLDFARSLMAFMFYGNAGQDGIIGTSDDIKDPFPEAFNRLRYSE